MINNNGSEEKNKVKNNLNSQFEAEILNIILTNSMIININSDNLLSSKVN